MSSILRRIVVSCVMALLCACGTTPVAPLEHLDTKTAATITVVSEPLVFARERSELAANARDYVTLVAMSVNRSGKYSYVLVGYFWSTVDRRAERGATAAAESAVLVADDRRIALVTPGKSLAQLGIAELTHAPPGAITAQTTLSTDLATLRFISAARNLRIAVTDDAAEPEYRVWKDGRHSLAAFVRHLDAGR